MSPDQILSDFVAPLLRVSRTGGGYLASCPVDGHTHGDRNPSLEIFAGNHRILTDCHIGHTWEQVYDALGYTPDDWKLNGSGPRLEIVATYDYTDETGNLLSQVVRYHPKDFRNRRPGSPGGPDWEWNLDDVRRVLYMLPKVLAETEQVFIVEGEKDADALTTAGKTATTNLGGAGKWQNEYAASLDHVTRVTVIADRDNPGRTHAQTVAKSLLTRGKVRQVEVVEPPEGCKDVSDLLNARLTVDDLIPFGTDELDTASIDPSDSDAYLHTPAPAQRVDPPNLASDQDILTRFKKEAGMRGLVGEERIAATIYLALTSRVLDKQVSIGLKGHSSSGKSFTVETVTKFFPPEAIIVMTAMSERALIYSKDDYRHRTLVVYEVVALREGQDDNLTSYLVRSLLSEGRIEYPVTVRDPREGGFTTKTIVKEGPTNLIFTTTKTKVHAENETRVLSLTSDDSREQTGKVLAQLAEEIDEDVDLKPWQQLQSWLATAEHRVTIPYARSLAEQVPPVAVRLRRDFSAVLALIRAHAILHQLNRGRDTSGRVVATLDDYDTVRDLVADVVAEGVGSTVPPVVRETVAAVATLNNADGVTVQALAAHLNLDQSTISRRVRMSADGGWLRNLEDKRGKQGRWVVGDPMPETAELLPHRRILETALDLGLCAYAPESEGYIDPEPVSDSVDLLAGVGLLDPPDEQNKGSRNRAHEYLENPDYVPTQVQGTYSPGPRSSTPRPPCTFCGLRLDPALADRTTHPNCEPTPPGTAPDIDTASQTAADLLGAVPVDSIPCPECLHPTPGMHSKGCPFYDAETDRIAP